MASTTDQQFLERMDLTFRSREADLRGRTARYWNEIFGASVGRVSVTSRSEGVDSVILPEATLFVFERKIVMLGSSEKWIDGAASLLGRTSDFALEGLVYQLRGFPGPSARELRRRMGLLREEIGGRLGSAVVVDDTVLFHPPTSGTRKSRAVSDRVCLQLTMKKLGQRVENLLHRPSYAQRQAGFSALGIKDSLKGFVLSEHHTLERYTLCGIKGREYFSFQVSMHEPASMAMFEYNGAQRAEISETIARLLLAFGPKQHKISALHMGAERELPRFVGQHWQPLPLGLADSLSVLVEGPARARLQASA